ncbi:Ig-like domain-containing protein [Maribacter sp. X9]|uniref:Ig-like domain-containing protein n=1 Tax=Maribacter sp. X9 TaxID=3402159 RepID=UPI003AF3F6F7
MNFTRSTLSQLTLVGWSCFLLFSCSKDADLLSEYVINENDNLQSLALLADDTFFISRGQNSILMDVLNNDNFGSNTKVSIVETSTPDNGTVTINGDNTLTYVPNQEATGTSQETTTEEDTFTYTTEVVDTTTETTTKEEATVTVTVSDDGPVKAFPTAFGGGSEATGGRGKVLAIINTLDRNAPLKFVPKQGNNDAYYIGGLFTAMQNKEVGYIVFNVSGNIDLGRGGTSAQYGYDGMGGVNDKTIFGQSAPMGGITLTGGSFRINGRFGDGNNLIFRYMRSRPIYDKNGNKGNKNGIAEDDAYTWAFLFYGGNKIMVDHCSASFSYDKNMGGYIDQQHVAEGSTMYGLTFQNNLVADGHTNMYTAINPGRPNDPQDHIGNISFLDNVIIGGNRTPNIAFNGQGEVNNNVIYAPMSKMINAYYNIELNHLNNYIFHPGTSGNITNAHQELGLNDSPRIFTQGNVYEGFSSKSNASSNNKLMWTDFGNRSLLLGLNFFSNTRLLLPGIPNQKPLETANQVYTKKIVNKNIGANKYLNDNGVVKTYQDSFDASMLNIALKRINKEWHQVSEWILPNIPNNKRPSSYDTDNDGMADAWEIKTFGNLSQSYRGDFDGDGYENIEEYMNQVDVNN